VLHISLLNTTVVAFKVLRLGSYAPIPVPSPPFKTILKPVLWNCLQSCRCITPVSSMSSKCLPFSISYIFGNKKKSLEGLDPVNRQGVPKQLLFSSQNLPHRRCRVSRCIVVMQDTWVVGKKFGSFPSKSFTQPFQCFQLVNFVDCLSSWYKFIMIPLISKKSQQHCFGSWFGPTDFFFWSWGIDSLLLYTLLLRFRVVLVDPCFITCDDTAQNVILPLQKVLANCDSSLLLFFGELLWEHFGTHLPHIKIFS